MEMVNITSTELSKVLRYSTTLAIGITTIWHLSDIITSLCSGMCALVQALR